MEKYVIVGGDAAGMSAAMQIVRNRQSPDITAFEKGPTFSYAQCGLPYYIGGDVDNSSRLIARSESQFREKFGINTLSMHEVSSIDPGEKVVRFTDLRSGGTGEAAYDKLLLATGARPIVPDWEGIQLSGVFCLKTLHDAERIKSYLEQAQVESCVIVGGGYIGLEMAEAFSNLGKRVTIVDRNPHLAGAWDKEISGILQTHIEDQGVHIRLAREVVGLSGENGRVAAVETDRESLPADIVLVAVGVKPNSELAKDAGIALGTRNAILVNEHLETNMPGIYAAGDAAVHYHRIKKQDDYIPLGTTANKQGRIAGRNMAGISDTFQGIAGTGVMKVFELGAARTGLSAKEAEALGIQFESVQIETKDHAGYYPGAAPLHIRMLANPQTGEILGGQAVGKHGADKRIDVLAAAMHKGITVNELLDLDLAYAPPFNGVWDPIQQAARRF